MKNDTTILPFRQSGSIADALTDLAREGAHRMLGEALKVEADGFVARFAAEHLEDGRQRIVRHGFGPQRQIQTGIGAPDVQRPRLRDRIATPDPAEKIRLTSTILPKWARRPVSLDGLLPVLYLKGISTGDFREALSAIIGPDARNLSPGVILSLTAGRQAEYDAWTRRDLFARHSICILSASYLHPGGWRLSSGSDGRKRWIYSGDHWRDSGGRERADWLSGRPAGKRTELDRTGMGS